MTQRQFHINLTTTVLLHRRMARIKYKQGESNGRETHRKEQPSKDENDDKCMQEEKEVTHSYGNPFHLGTCKEGEEGELLCIVVVPYCTRLGTVVFVSYPCRGNSYNNSRLDRRGIYCGINIIRIVPIG